MGLQDLIAVEQSEKGNGALVAEVSSDCGCSGDDDTLVIAHHG